MKNRYLVSSIIAVLIVMLSTPVIVLASSPESTDSSFAAEGASAYDNLMDSIYQSTVNGYDQLMGNSTSQTENIIGGVDYAKKIWVTLFYIVDVLTSVYRFAMLSSISFGVLIYFLTPRNKKVQKFALRFLIIALPVILTAFRYGIPVLYTDLMK